MPWNGLCDLRSGRNRIRDTCDTVLSASEYACIGRIGVCYELYLCDSADGMGNFDSAFGHCVANSIVREIHILIEKRLELRSTEEEFSRLVLQAVLPDHLQLTDGWESLIFRSVELFRVFGELAVRVWVMVIVIRRVVAPVVCMDVRLRFVVRLSRSVLPSYHPLLSFSLYGAGASHTTTNLPGRVS